MFSLLFSDSANASIKKLSSGKQAESSNLNNLIEKRTKNDEKKASCLSQEKILEEEKDVERKVIKKEKMTASILANDEIGNILSYTICML